MNKKILAVFILSAILIFISIACIIFALSFNSPFITSATEQIASIII